MVIAGTVAGRYDADPPDLQLLHGLLQILLLGLALAEEGPGAMVSKARSIEPSTSTSMLAAREICRVACA